LSDYKNKKSSSPIRVLLAEDEYLYQKIIEGYVHSFNLELTIVDNGKQCINQATEQHYDIILMDIVMPYKSGLEAARELRSHGITTPIIAITSNTWVEDEITSIEAGMNDFIAKPFDAKKLARKIVYWSNQKEVTV